MTWAIVCPCAGPSANVCKISTSNVPCRMSERLVPIPEECLLECLSALSTNERDGGSIIFLENLKTRCSDFSQRRQIGIPGIANKADIDELAAFCHVDKARGFQFLHVVGQG